MSSAQTALIVIVCPHCGTRYQVPPETIGKGRQVSCAHCGRTWKAEAPKPRREPPKPAPKSVSRPALKEVPKPKSQREDSDTLFDETDEAELDEAFLAVESGERPKATPLPQKASEKTREGGLSEAIKHLLPKADLPTEAMRSIAQIKAALAPKLEQAKNAHAGTDPGGEPVALPAAHTARGKVRQRQLQLTRNLPGSRMRRLARVGSISALALVLTAGFFLRTDLVRALPDLAGLYEAMGLKVNVVGLDFSVVETTRASGPAGDTLEVRAKIRPVEPFAVSVPQIVVTLFGQSGQQVYQWGVSPSVPSLSAGDTLEFSAELPNPPADAMKAVLSFSEAPTPPPQMAGGHGSQDIDGHGDGGASSKPAEAHAPHSTGNGPAASHTNTNETAPAAEGHAAPPEGPEAIAPAHQTEESSHHG